MRVDFYQLGAAPPEQVIASIAEKLLAQDERLLILGGDDAQLARLDRLLWDQGSASFFPHALSGGSDDSRQPILLATAPEAANRARNLLIADGKWREAALAFHRIFYLFDDATITEARDAWRSLTGSDTQRHYWANEDGRWVEKSAASRQRA